MKWVQLSTALGWFSIGLGLSELLMPRGMSKTIGLKRNHRMLMRLLGLREIGAGLAILAQPKKPAWMWSRVGGDAIDLALLGAALSMGAPGYVLYSIVYIPGVLEWLRQDNKAMLFDDVAKMQYPYVEEAREFLGLLICIIVLVVLVIRARRK